MSVQDQIRDLPLRHDGGRLGPRLDLDALIGDERLLAYRFPNGVTGFLTTNAADFKAILSDPRFHAKRFLGEPQMAIMPVDVPDMPGFIPSMNGPEHLRVRRLAAGDFTVKRVEALQPMIDGVVTKYLDQVAAHGSPADLYEMYCLQIPSEVIALILGVPHTHAEDFQNAARLTIGGLPDAMADPEAPAKAVARLHEIVKEVIAIKRETPGDDVITRLSQTDNPPLSDTEIAGLCTNLLLAGHETTATTGALAVATLLTQRDQYRTFKDHPERLPDFVDELVRFAFIIQDAGAGIPRLAVEDVNFHGVHIRAGDWVMPTTIAANIDPSVCPYAAPEQIDLNRDPIQHLTFGFGAHTCLGQHLARAELRSILSMLFARFPTLELVTPVDEMPWLESGFGYRMAELNVAW